MPTEIISQPGFEREVDALWQKLREVEARYPTFESRKTRFRFVCIDMIARIENATDGRFGDFVTRAPEAGYLALALGFAVPPVQSLQYERGRSDRINPPSARFPQEPSYLWPDIGRVHANVSCGIGYRLNDPACTPFTGFEMIISLLKFGGEMCDAAPDSHERNRKIILDYLKRWVREIDGMQPSPDSNKSETECEKSGRTRPRTAGEAVERLRDDWATCDQFGELTGKTAGAIRAAIARNADKIMITDVQEIPDATSQAVKKRYRVRAVWQFMPK